MKQKEHELLEKYFGNIVTQADIKRAETVGEYSLDLPQKIEAEYRAFLEEQWLKDRPEGIKTPLVLEEQTLRQLMTEDDCEGVDQAYRKAKRRTLWERLTKTNHKDVTYYKGLLREYTKELLFIMREDYLEEVTGHHIHNKAFSESYNPRPVDTSEINLPTDLLPLIEKMAKNVHEVWAEERIRQGWTYGEIRDDVKKKHPCLVPYEELPEEEKVYDRNTSMETLKLIIKLGFKIEKV